MIDQPSLRPLVVRIGAFGDMVLMIPVLKLLAARYGAPCDVVGSGPWTEPLLRRVPAVADITLLTSRRAPYWFNRSQQRLVRQLRARATGPVYVFEPDEKPLSWLRRAGIPADRVCTLRDFPRLPGEHILARCARLARATPIAFAGADASAALPLPDSRPTLSEQDRNDCAAWLDHHHMLGAPVVLLQPGNKKTMKGGDRRRRSNITYWPEENWAAVIRHGLETLPESRAIICGAPAERPFGDDIVAHLPADLRSRTLVAAGELPLPRLLALQASAHSMVSVNTGPAHSAAAMGCPLVALFTRHPHVAEDYYRPVATTAAVELVQPASNAPDAGLDQVAVDQVLAAWHRLVAR